MNLILLSLCITAGVGLMHHRTHHHHNYKERILLCTLAAVLISGLVASMVYLSKTQATEIQNGFVQGKERKHGQYVRSYDCNCYTVCTGSGEKRSCSRKCSTCYEDRYTVKWRADTSLGSITFKSLDESSRSVYNAKDPDSYVRCQVGDPVAQERQYIDYVKATPDSLFNTTMKPNYEVPNYPRVYDWYRINRVIDVASGVSPDALRELNRLLNLELRGLGAEKQVNIIVIVTGILDPSYRHDVENVWQGAKKNDVVVFLGIDENSIQWADVMTWALNSGNELFAVTLRDNLQGQPFDPAEINKRIVADIRSLYDRPKMEKFAYLREEIKPGPITILCTLLAVLAANIAIFRFNR